MTFENYEAVNVFHYCPRCGSDGFAAESEKNLRCPSCGLVYYINAAGTVVGVIQAGGGKVVFTVREKEPAAGTLDLPGGFIDFRETAEEALAREIKEELNLDVTSHAYLCAMPNLYVYGDILYHTIDLFFLCEVADINAIHCREEVSGYRFIPLAEVDFNQVGFESIKRGITHLRKEIDAGNVFFE